MFLYAHRERPLAGTGQFGPYPHPLESTLIRRRAFDGKQGIPGIAYSEKEIPGIVAPGWKVGLTFPGVWVMLFVYIFMVQ